MMNPVMLEALQRDAETAKKEKGVLHINPNLAESLAGYTDTKDTAVETKKSDELAVKKLSNGKLFGANVEWNKSVLTWEVRIP